MMRRKLLLLAALLPASLWANEHLLLIGGGASPDASEAQIEFNVKWVIASLREMIPDAAVTVWYAGGKNPPPNTVAELLPQSDTAIPHEALAAVYGHTHENRLRFRAHTVADVAGTTERDSLLPALTAYLTGLKAGDQAMVIYNGHGTWEADRANNALRLWNKTYLSVRDFERLLAQVDPKVPVRFVMTQCYSGAFARAVYEHAEPSPTLAIGARCGFFAESSERESEGCSASVELGDYRDYTTYFISGLTGKDRLGRDVAKATDRDGDGKLSPLDSHLYTLLEGYNGDLPRSTSEDYLERAQPWYSRWVGTARLPDNVYGRLAREMAVRYGLPEDGRALGRTLRARYDSLSDEVGRIKAERTALEEETDRTRTVIRERIEAQHPQLRNVSTAALSELVSVSTAPIEAELRSDRDYRTLRDRERRLEEMELHLVDLDRLMSQLDRLRRARLMARALAQIGRRGTTEVQGAYEQLRACEALPLGQ